jgi:hypothetical protein
MMRPLLRGFGIVFLGPSALIGLALAPATGGLSLVLGIPAGLSTVWLVRHDPAERPEATRGAFVALAIGALFLVWVFVTLISDMTIWGRQR